MMPAGMPRWPQEGFSRIGLWRCAILQRQHTKAMVCQAGPPHGGICPAQLQMHANQVYLAYSCIGTLHCKLANLETVRNPCHETWRVVCICIASNPVNPGENARQSGNVIEQNFPPEITRACSLMCLPQKGAVRQTLWMLLGMPTCDEELLWQH